MKLNQESFQTGTHYSLLLLVLEWTEPALEPPAFEPPELRRDVGLDPFGVRSVDFLGVLCVLPGGVACCLGVAAMDEGLLLTGVIVLLRLLAAGDGPLLTG